MKWNLGDKITSIAIEGYGSIGTIVDAPTCLAKN